MAARKQHNRYRTEPYGTNYEDVLKRGKAFHTYGDLHEPFMMMPYKEIWTASRLPVWGGLPQGSIVYRWNGKRWEKQ